MAVDLKRVLPGYRARQGRFDVLDLPPAQYLAIDGAGDPNTSAAYAAALATLYPMAQGLKFRSARVLGRDHTVLPLEALWWADDMTHFTSARDKSRWRWTAMIRLPDWIGAGDVEAVRSDVARRGRAPSPDDARLALLEEGLVVQTLHRGPYDAEGPLLAEMHDEVIPARGLRMTGRHHEIYLGDPRRAAPENLRTILRQPVERT